MKKLTSWDIAFIVFVLFTILACIFSGCADTYYPNTKLVVGKISYKNNSNICKYSDIYEEEWIVFDSCSKWNIGDTINVIIN